MRHGLSGGDRGDLDLDAAGLRLPRMGPGAVATVMTPGMAAMEIGKQQPPGMVALYLKLIRPRRFVR